MSRISVDQLSSLIDGPDARALAAVWAEPLNAAMDAASICTPARQAAFLAQVMVESSQLKTCEENLRYSAQRMRAVWPSHFATDAIAQPYDHQPEKLANRVYADRMGNGDEASGDGWRYRGRGLIQLTGRDNYAAFGQAMAVDALGDPDMLLRPDGAALSAAWFWQNKQLNALADDASPTAFAGICRLVNGGDNGLPQRQASWARAKQALGVA